MSPGKKTGATSKPQPEPAASPAAASSEASGQPATESKRKPWIKKTPVEHVLDQIGKQEKKVTDMREELKKEERELAKLQQAKKLLEGA